MYIYYQPNPCGRAVGDCAVRAISAAFNIDWEEAFDILASFAKSMCDMPASDQVWGAALRANGFRKAILPTYCPHCYTMEDFCKNFPHGIYVVGFGGHVATVIAVAITVNGEPRPTSRAIITPAAVEEYGNVTSTAIIKVPRGCCFSVSVRTVSASNDPTVTPTPVVEVQNANFVIDRIA